MQRSSNACLVREIPAACSHASCGREPCRPSIDAPSEFIQTNIVGTFTLLQRSLHHWRNLREPVRKSFRFLHVSTDEVFGSLGAHGLFTEASPTRRIPPTLQVRQLQTISFAPGAKPTNTGIITNCSNNYGPYHFPEKLIPHMIIKGLAEEMLPVYGDGQNVRDWLYVEDHAHALTQSRFSTVGSVKLIMLVDVTNAAISMWLRTSVVC